LQAAQNKLLTPFQQFVSWNSASVIHCPKAVKYYPGPHTIIIAAGPPLGMQEIAL